MEEQYVLVSFCVAELLDNFIFYFPFDMHSYARIIGDVLATLAYNAEKDPMCLGSFEVVQQHALTCGSAVSGWNDIPRASGMQSTKCIPANILH